MAAEKDDWQEADDWQETGRAAPAGPPELKDTQGPQPFNQSGYAGIPDDELNILQKADRAVAAPGYEMISPAAIEQKKLAGLTAANTVTGGYLPQITAAIESGQISGPDYLQARDAMVRRLGQAQGGTRASGTALGMLPGMAAGSLLPTAKSVTGRVASATGLGALAGFAQNPGDEQGKYDASQLGPRLTNARSGAMVAGATSAAANVPAMRDYFRKQASFRALKQGGAMLRDYRGFDTKPGSSIDAAGQMMLEPLDGPGGKPIQVVTPGASTEDIVDRSAQLMQHHGQRIGAVQDTLDRNFAKLQAHPQIAPELVDPHRVAQDIEDRIIAPTIGTKMEDATSEVQSVVDDLRRLPPGPTRFSDIKRQMDGIDHFVQYSREQTPQKELLKRARGIINGHIEGAVDAIGKATNFPLYEEWKHAKQIYGTMKDVNEMAGDKIFRNQANRYISPSDYGSMGLGAMASHGDPLVSAATGVANHGMRVYGNSLAATGANAIAKGLSGPAMQQAAVALPRAVAPAVIGMQQLQAAAQPRRTIDRLKQNPQTAHYAPILEAAAAKGDQNFAAVNYMLNSKDPAYRAATMKTEPEEEMPQ